MNDTMIPVAREDAADWLLRSALPRLLELIEQVDDARYFRDLPPFEGLTPSGRVRGWRGAGKRVKAVEEDVAAGQRMLLYNLQPMRKYTARTTWETTSRQAGVYTRKFMLPSRLGWDAYRLLARCGRLAEHRAQTLIGDNGDAYAQIDQAWSDVFSALADRAVLREMTASPNEAREGDTTINRT